MSTVFSFWQSKKSVKKWWPARCAACGLLACLAFLIAGRAVQARDQLLPYSTNGALITSNLSLTSRGWLQAGPHRECMSCHGNSNLKMTFANEEELSLAIEPQAHLSQVHGQPLLCPACHTETSDYPHDPAVQNCPVCHQSQTGDNTSNQTTPVKSKTPSKRAFALSVNEKCRACHAEKFPQLTDSVHTRLAEQGNDYAPTCVDCHRNFQELANPRSREAIGKICSQCHLSVYTSYLGSAHGAALTAEGNSDVPTCANCHGIHTVRGPSDPQFHNDIPTLCGKCHADAKLMSKYGVSTDVFQTYQADFHGKTVQSFREQNSNLPSAEAVCTDCHGTHNIRRTDDPKSTVAEENLLETCRHCHQEASFRFPAAWSGHKTLTNQIQPALFSVNQLYQILTLVVGAGCLVYVGLDVRGRRRDRSQEEESDDE